MSAPKAPWWRGAVGYQIYLPSFADSDGDGLGDLHGVNDRLDHLEDLGVDIVWLTPFFPSPMHDGGYDVVDYRGVDARYGDLEALKTLSDAVHARELRLMADLVVNHTSDQHPWFLDAVADPDGPFRDYYIWRNPSPTGGPPNNWVSHFGGPAWTREPKSGQYYLHLFTAHQPDLNWRNPAVADEVDAVLRYWFELGFDGVRIDTAAYLLKHEDLVDNPTVPNNALLRVTGATEQWRRQQHLHDIHQTGVHDIHARWRSLADEHDAFLVGEVYELDPEALAEFVDDDRLHSSFWFGSVEAEFSAESCWELVEAAAAAPPKLSWVLSNHDRPRAVTRYGGGPIGQRRALLVHTLMSLLPGTWWLYQGEELALTDGVLTAPSRDPLALSQTDQGRDGSRTPMPWTTGPVNGFSVAQPWLAARDRDEDETVQWQRAHPSSPLRTMRRLISVRRSLTSVLPRDISFKRHAYEPLVGYRRGSVVVVANPTGGPLPFETRGECLFDTHAPTSRAATTPRVTETVTLQPYQAMVLRDEAGAAVRAHM